MMSSACLYPEACALKALQLANIYTYCIYRRNLRGGMHLRVR
jgi:hypothetical protein